jgi:hypothetical protein
MEHDGLYDNLLLLGLLWLSMLLYWGWLRGWPATSPTTLTPAISIKKRSKGAHTLCRPPPQTAV